MPQRRTVDRILALEVLLGTAPWARDQLIAAGWSADQIDRAVRAGALSRVRRAVFAPGPDVAGSAVLPELDRCRAVLRGLDDRAAVSHETAAGLRPLWVPWPPRNGTQVTIAGQAERTDGDLTVHGSRLPEEFVEIAEGVRMTTPARTAMDLGRGRSLPDALVALDGTARFMLGASDPEVASQIRRRQLPALAYEEVRTALEDAFAVVWSWPGTRVLRQALELFDPASESPLESWSRGCFAIAELPPPLVGWPVRGASGRLYYADFLWKDAGVIGEADGLTKYGVTADEQRRRHREQRRRQDDLEAAGWRFVRWVSGEPAETVSRRVAVALGVPRVVRRAR